MNVFLQLSKNVKIVWREIWTVGRMLRISCAVPVHANMTCCVRRKQQTCDVGIPVPPPSAVKIRAAPGCCSLPASVTDVRRTHVSLTSRPENKLTTSELSGCCNIVCCSSPPDVSSAIKFQWYQLFTYTPSART